MYLSEKEKRAKQLEALIEDQDKETDPETTEKPVSSVNVNMALTLRRTFTQQITSSVHTECSLPFFYCSILDK